MTALNQSGIVHTVKATKNSSFFQSTVQFTPPSSSHPEPPPDPHSTSPPDLSSGWMQRNSCYCREWKKHPPLLVLLLPLSCITVIFSRTLFGKACPKLKFEVNVFLFVTLPLFRRSRESVCSVWSWLEGDWPIPSYCCSWDEPTLLYKQGLKRLWAVIVIEA